MSPIAPNANARFTVEQDDECTAFDPKPWGAQQRMLPTRTFVDRLHMSARAPDDLRVSGPLGARSIASVPSLPLPSLPGMAPLPTAAMTAALPMPMPMPMTPMAALHTLAQAPVAVLAPVVRHFDRALSVHSASPTTLSRAGVPVGIALSVLAMIIGYFAQPSLNVRNKPLAALASMRSEPAREFAIPPPSPQPQTIALPAVPDEQLMTPAATFEAEPTIEPTVPTARPAKHEAPAKAKRPARKAKSSSKSTKRRPRKIVAGDTSTPLGGLRPRRF